MPGRSALQKTTPKQGTSSADKAQFQPLRGLPTVLWGDSYCALNDKVTGTPNTYGGTLYRDANGWANWLNIFLGQRLEYVHNAGITGQKTSEWLPRFAADVKPYNPALVIISSPVTNDVIASVSLATIQANITAALDLVASIGATAMITTCPPKSSSAFGATQLGIAHGYNHWIKQQAIVRKNLIVVDIHPALSDATAADNFLNSSQRQFTADGTHPGAWGAARIGRLMFNALDPILPKLDRLPFGSAANNATVDRNLITNGGLTGTAGTPSNGITGSLADSWQLQSLNGSAVPGTVVASKVARTDQKGGEWQQVSVSGTASGWGLKWSVVPAAGWVPGVSQLEAWWEIQSDADITGLVTFRPVLQAWLSASHADVWAFDLGGQDQGLPVSENPLTGVLRTPVLIPPSDATRLDMIFQFNGIGTVRIGRPWLRLVA